MDKAPLVRPWAGTGTELLVVELFRVQPLPDPSSARPVLSNLDRLDEEG
jgi:hypothetical protein